MSERFEPFCESCGHAMTDHKELDGSLAARGKCEVTDCDCQDFELPDE